MNGQPTAGKSVNATEHATVVSAFKVTIDKKGDDPLRATTGKVRGRVQDYIEHSNTLKGVASTACNREKGEITFFNMSEEEVRAALKFAHENVGFYSRFKVASIEPLAGVAVEPPTHLRRAEEQTTDQLREELRVAEDKLRAAEAANKLQQEQFSSERNTLIVGKTGLEARVKQLEPEVQGLQEKLAAAQAEAKKDREMIQPTVVADTVTLTMMQWLPNAEAISTTLATIFNGKPVVEKLNQVLALTSYNRFAYMQTTLQSAGVVIQTQGELDTLLESGVSWEQSKAYQNLGGDERLERAKKTIEWSNKVTRFAPDIPEEARQSYDKVRDDALKVVYEFEKAKEEYLSRGQKEKDLAIALAAEYDAATRFKVLLEGLPPMPVSITIRRSQEREAEIRYPPVGTDSIIETTIDEIVNAVMPSSAQIKERAQGRFVLSLNTKGPAPAIRGLPIDIDDALHKTILHKLGLRVSYEIRMLD